MPSPEYDPAYTIDRLNKKINADQVEMAKMLEDNQQMQAALERKKASEQLAAWAIDRAIETRKASGAEFNARDVISDADSYCAWIAEFRQEHAATQETMLSASSAVTV